VRRDRWLRSDAPVPEAHALSKPVEDQLAVILKRGSVDLVEERRPPRSGSRRRVKSEAARCASSSASTRRRPTSISGTRSCCASSATSSASATCAVVLWGTATARVGDPTGKNKTRPQLSARRSRRTRRPTRRRSVAVLDLDRIEERENGEWFDRMDFMDRGPARRRGDRRAHAGARLVREALHRRGEPISVHELLYPLMQGWDSVELAPTSSSAAPTSCSTC
jgi:hypothetical protein